MLESIAITIVITILTTARASSLLFVLIIYICVHKKRKNDETSQKIPNTVTVAMLEFIKILHITLLKLIPQ